MFDILCLPRELVSILLYHSLKALSDVDFCEADNVPQAKQSLFLAAVGVRRLPGY